ncbi:hypothetical protein OGAPHI_003373 [Ogataea philodendri]|uniref:Uncharacterized protein n=1 Tax=Ogataea philodendri TaxID=1378263 RepID=A0A9P8P6X3_9ASCO|nr:uncharacterized protein OGAPHI_003373 [Ogataea philodendri]KAH3666923.1 hypothetical protein OGAPHI_003373 [Ogataea philodendri]
MVDTDHRQFRTLGGVDLDGWFLEHGGDRVHRNRVVWVGGVCRNVHDGSKVSLFSIESLQVDKWRNWLRKVDTVHKDVCFDDFLERTALCGFFHVPFQDVVFRNANFTTKVNGTRSASSQSTNHKNLWVLASLGNGGLQGALDVGNKGLFVRVRSHTAQLLRVGMGLFESPVFHTQRSTCKSGEKAERSNTSSLVVFQKLEIVQNTVSSRESRQHVVPASLVLVTVGKLDVFVNKRERFLRQLLQTNDDSVLWSVHPRTFLDNMGARSLVLLPVERRLRRFLDVDLEIASVQQLLSGLRCKGCSGLQRFGLCSQMKDNFSHD